MLRRLDGLLHGSYRTLFRGAGLDLADVREYQPHDDVRHIDWNVTARLQSLHVRQYLEDREVVGWFLLDLSPSVDFGSESSKREVLEQFVAVLARVLTRHGNPVGAILYGAGIEAVIPPRTGRRQVLQVLHALMNRPTSRQCAAHRPRRTAARGDPGDAAPVARVPGLGLHQHAGLGEAAGAAEPPARGGGRAVATIRPSASCPSSGWR